MANEIRVNLSLQINRYPTQYQSRPTSFNDDMTGFRGPTPGIVLALTHPGTAVDLSKLDVPGGWCRIQNLDQTYPVDIGVFDTVTNKFYPMCRLKAAKQFILPLAPTLGHATGTGSGTSPGDADQLYLKAVGTSPIQVLVEAFDG